MTLSAGAAAAKGRTIFVATHAVEDYATWRAAYDGFAEQQKAAGVIEEMVFQSPDDPNQVIVVHYFNSPEEATALAQSEKLKQAMAEAGVVGAPTIMIGVEAD